MASDHESPIQRIEPVAVQLNPPWQAQILRLQDDPDDKTNFLIERLLQEADGKVRRDLNYAFSASLSKQCLDQCKARDIFYNKSTRAEIIELLGLEDYALHHGMTVEKLLNLLILPGRFSRFQAVLDSYVIRVRALAHAEYKFRCDWLPGLDKNIQTIAGSPLWNGLCSDVDAFLAFSVLQHPSRYDQIVAALARRTNDFQGNHPRPEFCQLLHSMLDDAIHFATDDSTVVDGLSSLPSPLTDCEAFLQRFWPIWNQLFTWQVAYTSNKERLDVTT